MKNNKEFPDEIDIGFGYVLDMTSINNVIKEVGIVNAIALPIEVVFEDNISITMNDVKISVTNHAIEEDAFIVDIDIEADINRKSLK